MFYTPFREKKSPVLAQDFFFSKKALTNYILKVHPDNEYGKLERPRIRYRVNLCYLLHQKTKMSRISVFKSTLGLPAQKIETKRGET
jgi:hypothetical protein